MPTDRSRPARIEDVHALARAMPHVRELTGPKGNTIAWLAQASPRRRDAWLAEHAP